MTSIIRGRAPLRISFSGGGTDVEPYPSLIGGAVINTAIDRYAYVSLNPNKTNNFNLYSQDYGLLEKFKHISEIIYDGKLDLVKAAIKNSKLPNHGFDALIHVDSPPGSGLGSSSALAVSLIGTLNRLLKKKLTKNKIAEKAFNIERIELGIKGGKQDQYAAAFGGFNLLEFKKKSVSVKSLKLKKEFLNELLASILICNTNITRLSGNILERQSKSYSTSNPNIMENLDFIKKSTFKMKDYLLSGDLKQVAELLHEGWIHKKQLDSKISSRKLDSLYDAGIKNGALGGKLLGAGGGGHFLFLCDPDKREQISKIMQKRGCGIVKVNFDFDGLQVWENKNHKIIP